MGKKSSSSAPAVDPAVGQALQQQAALAQQQQNWMETEIYPWLQQQTQKQNEYSEADRAMAMQNYQFWQNMASEQTERANAMSDEFYNRWKENYLPIENALLADAKNYNTSAEAERQAAYAIGDATTAYNVQKQALNQQLAQYGVNPTSGAYAAQNRAMDVNQAAVRAAAANQARSAARELRAPTAAWQETHLETPTLTVSRVRQTLRTLPTWGSTATRPCRTLGAATATSACRSRTTT